MRLFSEEDILNPGIRATIIKEIEGHENISRKREHFKRYEILKDRVKKYILENLIQELDPATVRDMQSRISTINLLKKVVSKKARVYKNAPRRDSEDQEALDALVDKINLNVSMKKTNKYLEAFLNSDVFIRPVRDAISQKWFYRVDPLAPFQYDVIEDAGNPESAVGYILSPYSDRRLIDDNPQDREKSGLSTNFRSGDGKDQIIADSPQDKVKEYVWWGSKYHFTFTVDGIHREKSPADMMNPIGRIPFVSVAKDRDGSFWSVGGEDLVEGAILVNTILSDIYYIAKMHGTGLFYFFGDGAPKNIKVGPNSAVTLDTKGSETTPQIGFANANPQLSDHMKLIEQYVALLLTTNDLEPGSVSGQLSASGAASGIQEMIIKAEPINKIEDDQELFRDAEPEVVNIAAMWHNFYLGKGLLRDDFAAIGKMPEGIDYTMSFGAVSPYQSEKEKLDVIEKRLDIGLDDIIGAMLIDNPDMTEEEALEKVAELKKRGLERMKASMEAMIEGDEEAQPDGDDEGDEPGAEIQGDE